MSEHELMPLEEIEAIEFANLCIAKPDWIDKLLSTARAAHALKTRLRTSTQAFIEIVGADGPASFEDVVERVAALKEENEKLQQTLERQTRSYMAGLQAAKSVSANRLQEAARLRAESSPEVVSSEREANSLLTEENEKLREDIKKLSALVKDVNALSEKLQKDNIKLRAELTKARAEERERCAKLSDERIVLAGGWGHCATQISYAIRALKDNE